MLNFKRIRSLLLVALIVSNVGCFGTRNRCCSPRPTTSSAPCCPNPGTTVVPAPGLGQ